MYKTDHSGFDAAFPLRDGGYLRLKQIIQPDGPLPISRSSWWEGVRTGRYPSPVKLGPRITAWRCEDIKELCRQAAERSGILR